MDRETGYYELLALYDPSFDFGDSTRVFDRILESAGRVNRGRRTIAKKLGTDGGPRLHLAEMLLLHAPWTDANRDVFDRDLEALFEEKRPLVAERRREFERSLPDACRARALGSGTFLFFLREFDPEDERMGWVFVGDLETDFECSVCLPVFCLLGLIDPLADPRFDPAAAVRSSASPLYSLVALAGGGCEIRDSGTGRGVRLDRAAALVASADGLARDAIDAFYGVFFPRHLERLGSEGDPEVDPGVLRGAFLEELAWLVKEHLSGERYRVVPGASRREVANSVFDARGREAVLVVGQNADVLAGSVLGACGPRRFDARRWRVPTDLVGAVRSAFVRGFVSGRLHFRVRRFDA